MKIGTFRNEGFLRFIVADEVFEERKRLERTAMLSRFFYIDYKP